MIKIDRPMPRARVQNALTRRFWEGLARGEFSAGRCTHCGAVAFPPREFCVNCGSTSVELYPLSGMGRLYSRTVIHVPPAGFERDVPFAIGLVDLDEDFRIICRLIEPSGNPIALDTTIELVTLKYRNGCLYGARENHA